LPGYRPLLKPLIEKGKIVREFEDVDKIRERILKNLDTLPEKFKIIEGGKPPQIIFKP
jgi:uncharacterized protein (DUF1919 family)